MYVLFCDKIVLIIFFEILLLFSEEEKKMYKAKRRTLKNRFYAQTSRNKFITELEENKNKVSSTFCKLQKCFLKSFTQKQNC